MQIKDKTKVSTYIYTPSPVSDSAKGLVGCTIAVDIRYTYNHTQATGRPISTAERKGNTFI